MKIKVLHISIIITLLFIFTDCSNDKSNSYPLHLTKAIQYFYTENENPRVLFELDSLTHEHQRNFVNQMSLLFSSAALCEMGKVDSAAALFKTVKRDTLDKNFSFWCNSIEGLILFRQDKPSTAYQVLSKTVTFKNADLRALGLNERILGRISLTLGDQNKGLEWLLLSTKHFEQAGYIKSTGVNYKLLGRHYVNDENYRDAIRNFELAEKVLKKYNDKSELFYVYINLVDCYVRTKEISKARFYANKCLTQFNDISDNLMKTLIYNNMGEIEMSGMNYDAAINYFNMTLQIPANYKTSGFRRANAHIKLAKIYRTIHNEKEALYHAQQARSYLPSNEYHLIKSEVFNELAENYRLLNSPALAYRMLDTASMNIDSAYNSITTSIKDFYETKSNLYTLSDNMELMKDKEKTHRYVFITIILGLALLLIFAYAIYRLQRSKTKVLKVLVEKNLQIMADERKQYASVKPQMEGKKVLRRGNDQEKFELIYKNLQIWLETDNHFVRKDLSLELVAKELNTNREYLSCAISERNVRFNDLINKYRVLEATRILSDKNNKRSRYSLSAIASEVGFNSNSVFIDAFRKQTGMNPAQFRQNLNNSEEV